MRIVMGSRRTPPTAKSSERTPTPTTVVTIKQEAPEDDIKEYAETAMNELLGWYGYDKVDSRDTQGLNLHHFAAHQRSAGSDLDSSDSATSPPSSRGINRESPDLVGLPSGCSICAWCQKICNNKQLFSLKTPNGQKNFCSEVCFTQCRRANFKRNKTCDWCRHVRHTVNYVDFQDGEHQLQFCSDKCLNQYKMNIFCRETQAHLQMHPHLQDGAGNGSGGGGGTLITPDLWMRDCRSESPSSDHSVSPVSPPPPPAVSPPPVETKESTKSPRRTRSKRMAVTTPTPSDLRTSCSPRSIESLSPPKNSAHLPTQVIHSPPHLLPPLRPPTPFLPHGLLPPPPGIFHNHRNSPNFPPIIRAPRTSPNTPNTTPPTRPPPLLPLPLRANRVNQPASIPPTQLPPPPPPPPPPSTSAIPTPLSRYMMPPVTVMVPYPIVLPLPIPIPIPIPIPLFSPKNNKIIPSPPPEEKSSLPPETAASENQNMPPSPVTTSSRPIDAIKDSPPKKPTLNDRPLRKRKRLEAQTEGGNILKRKFVPA